MKILQSKKKKFQMFFRAKKFMEIQQSLVDSPSTSPSSFPGAGEFSNSNSCNPSKSLQKKTQNKFHFEKKNGSQQKQHENSEIIFEFPRQESTKRRFFFG